MSRRCWQAMMGWLVLTGLSMANAQSNWPAADSLYQVDVIVFEQAHSSPPVRAERVVSVFENARQLSSPATAHALTIQAQPRPAPGVRPLAEWLDWLVTQALIRAAQPLVGPPPRIDVPEAPLLNHPVLWQQPVNPPTDLARAAARLEQARGYEVVSTLSWHQPLRQNASGVAVRLVPDASLSLPPWPTPLARGPRPRIDGQLTLTRDRFLRAKLELKKTTPHRHNRGPLSLRWLSPFGALTETLDADRVIPTEQWVYFDHPSLGALVQITPLESDG